jgi:hypothetical protein
MPDSMAAMVIMTAFWLSGLVSVSTIATSVAALAQHAQEKNRPLIYNE